MTYENIHKALSVLYAETFIAWLQSQPDTRIFLRNDTNFCPLAQFFSEILNVTVWVGAKYLHVYDPVEKRDISYEQVWWMRGVIMDVDRRITTKEFYADDLLALYSLT